MTTRYSLSCSPTANNAIAIPHLHIQWLAIFVSLLFLLTATQAQSRDDRVSGPYIMFGAGGAELDINNRFAINGTAEQDSVGGVHIGAGFLTNIGLLVEYSATGYSDFFDAISGEDGYEFSQNKWALGYAFKLNDSGTVLIPKVGYADWTLGGYESNGIFPLVVIEPTEEVDGDDVFYELGLYKNIGTHASLGINYHHMETDFDRFSNLYVSLEFSFWDTFFK